MSELALMNKSTQVLESEAVLSSMERSLAMIEFNMDGIVLWANGNFAAAMGYDREEMPGMRHKQFCTPEFASSDAYRALWANLRDGKSFQEKIRRVAKNGELLWLEATYMPVRGTDGSYRGVLKVATDITAREQAALAHAEALRRMAQELLGRAGEGKAKSREIESAIDRVRADSEENIDRLQRLGRQAEAIRGIVRAIREVASQTQLLALNAAIEAAHAGAFGRGFDVVASEVRKLAGQVQEAAKKANAEVEDIAARMTEIGRGTERSQASVEQGLQRVREAVETFRLIDEAARGLDRQANALDEA